MADNNAKSATPSGKAQSNEAIPQHKRMAMGKPVPQGSGPKTPA